MAKSRRKRRSIQNKGFNGRATGLRKIRNKVSPYAGEFAYEVRFMRPGYWHKTQTDLDPLYETIRNSCGTYKIRESRYTVRSSSARKNHHSAKRAVIYLGREADLFLLKLLDCEEAVFRVYRLTASAA